jgi:hypothetical protein
MALLLGSNPNQVSTNGDLGTAAFIDAKQLPVSGPQKAINDAQDAIQSSFNNLQDTLIALKANLDSPLFTGSVRIPNVTTTQKNAIAPLAIGLLVFDTTLAKLSVFTGAGWQTISSS